MKRLFFRLTQWVENLVRSLCRMLILAVSIAGLILLFIDGVSKFFTSSDFTVREITISGNERVNVDDIRTLAQVAPGTNIWMVDLEDLAQRLEAQPAIRRATVQRFPPARIHIAIEERHAIAFYFLADGGLMGLDGDGVALPPPSGLSPESPGVTNRDDLNVLLTHPVLSGDLHFPEQSGEQSEDLHLKAILVFLEQFQTRTPAIFQEAVEGQWRSSGDLLLHMRRQIGMLVLRDLTAVDLIPKINAVWNMMEKDQLRAMYVDGRFPEKGFAVHSDGTQGEEWARLYTNREKT